MICVSPATNSWLFVYYRHLQKQSKEPHLLIYIRLYYIQSNFLYSSDIYRYKEGVTFIAWRNKCVYRWFVNPMVKTRVCCPLVEICQHKQSFSTHPGSFPLHSTWRWFPEEQMHWWLGNLDPQTVCLWCPPQLSEVLFFVRCRRGKHGPDAEGSQLSTDTIKWLSY